MLGLLSDVTTVWLQLDRESDSFPPDLQVRVGILSDSIAWDIHDVVVDSFFAIDIVLHFITGYEDVNQ